MDNPKTVGGLRVCRPELSPRDHWAHLLDIALDECGLSEVKVAESMGRDRKAIRRWRDAAGKTGIEIHEIPKLPDVTRRMIIQHLAQSIGCELVDCPSECPPESDVRALGQLASETAQAISAYGASISDGHITAEEADVIERECTDGIRVLAAVRERARGVRKERVVGVTR